MQAADKAHHEHMPELPRHHRDNSIEEVDDEKK
jgi:hypothetical protein